MLEMSHTMRKFFKYICDTFGALVLPTLHLKDVYLFFSRAAIWDRSAVAGFIFVQSKNDKSICSLFLKEVATKSCSIAYWSKFVNTFQWESVWLLPHKFVLVTDKVKYISFKIIHKFYPVKHFLSTFKKDIDVFTFSVIVVMWKTYGMMCLLSKTNTF